MPKLNNLTGKTFDKLTVLEKAPSRARHVYWKCQCECGNIIEVSAESLKRNIPHNCGCVKLQSQKEKEQAKEDKKFDAALTEILQYLVGNWRRLNNNSIFNILGDLSTWSTEKFALVYRLIEKIKEAKADV